MIAYFILVHRYPQQFKRLFRAIYNPQDSFLVHIDKRAGMDLYKEVKEFLEAFSNAHLLESQNVVWWWYSMVEAELRGIRKLLELSLQWNFFINLSGQDFPIKSSKEIRTFLNANAGIDFITVANQELERPNTMNRINNYFTESETGFSWSPYERPYMNQVTPYIGGQWKILSRSCCEFLCTSPKVEKFIAYYKNTLIPDESFFQTVLMNTGYSGTIINNDKRAIIWIPDIGIKLTSQVFTESETNALIKSWEIKLRPKTFTSVDYSYLLSSSALFGRKFDETVDDTIIDMLEESFQTEW